MARLRLNPRRAKTHRTYSVAEVAELFDVTRSTVRAWTNIGLPMLQSGRLILIVGEELQAFLAKRQAAQRSKCSAGTIYCLSCRTPRTPKAEGLALIQVVGTTGNVRGLCPCCGSVMHRRVALRSLGEIGFAALG